MATTTDQLPITTTTTAVGRLLEAIETGRGAAAADVLAPKAVLDATVPGWRFQLKGAGPISRQFGAWFAHPGRFEELDRRVSGDVEFVTYLLSWEENGIPYAAHQSHRLSIDASGLIAADQFFCGGRWDAGLLAEMAEANNAG